MRKAREGNEKPGKRKVVGVASVSITLTQFELGISYPPGPLILY